MDLIILYWLLLTPLFSSNANKYFVLSVVQTFSESKIKLVAESYPNLPFSLFKDRHWLSLHEPSKQDIICPSHALKQ